MLWRIDALRGHEWFPPNPEGGRLRLGSLDHILRDRIAEACSRFDTVTVHGHQRDLNIASHNPGIRRESIRQYLQCIEFAHAIGARWVTFHPGHYQRLLSDEQTLRDRNIEFGKRAAEMAEQYDFLIGYEEMGLVVGNHFEHLLEVIDKIGSTRFGLNFDIGHAWMLGSPPPYQWIDTFRGKIVGLHLHGTFHRPDRGLATHMPMEYDDCYNLKDLFKHVRASGFQGPMIFEIMSASIDRYLHRARRGKDLVCRLWDVA